MNAVVYQKRFTTDQHGQALIRQQQRASGRGCTRTSAIGCQKQLTTDQHGKARVEQQRRASKNALLLLVIPAQAGIHVVVAKVKMDYGLRRNDGKGEIDRTFPGRGCTRTRANDCQKRLTTDQHGSARMEQRQEAFRRGCTRTCANDRRERLTTDQHRQARMEQQRRASRNALILLVIPAKAGIQVAAAKIKMDYAPLLRRTRWAIGFADVRFGILPSQPGSRRNDGKGAVDQTFPGRGCARTNAHNCQERLTTDGQG